MSEDNPNRELEMLPGVPTSLASAEGTPKNEPPPPSATKSAPKKRGRGKKPEFDWSTQGALVLGGVLFTLILLYALLGMCRLQKSPKRTWNADSDASVMPATVQYGDETLPGKTFVGLEAVRGDKTPELVAEVKKVIDSQGTPSDVFSKDVPREHNIASALGDEFRIYRQNPGELEQLRREVPSGTWSIGQDAIGRVTTVLERVEPKRQRVRELLNQKEICFAFEFTQDPDYGEIPDTDAADFLDDYVMLEEFAIARALLEGRPDQANESLAYIFRLAQLAAEVKNLGVRTRAAQIRLLAMDIVQTVVLDPNYRENHLAYLYSMLHEQLDDWISDADAWIGERASGMKVYNMILQYGIEPALEPDELTEMIRRGAVQTDKVGRAVLTNYRNLARDQVFYLRTMESVIQSCLVPFFQRRDALNQIEGRIRENRGTEEEAIIAEMLMRGIREMMQCCAQERTKCEAGILALATSLKNSTLNNPISAHSERIGEQARKTIDSLKTDPLNGTAYEVRQFKNTSEPKTDIVWVSYSGNLKPFRVPDFSMAPPPPSPNTGQPPVSEEGKMK